MQFARAMPMSRRPQRRFPAPGFLALLLFAAPAFAGEADFEPEDFHEHGHPYFGEAKDIKGLVPVADVRMKVKVKGTQHFFIVQTDADGRFRRNGLGTDVDPEKVDFTCEKDGYRTVEVMHRKMSTAKFSPVEIECLLAKN
jgi:hypothetical protein